MSEPIKILGLNISISNYEEIIAEIEDKIHRREILSFHNVNVNIALIYERDKNFRGSLDKFTKLYSDGIGMYAASKFIYGKNGLKKLITGTDLYYKILELANRKSLKCFFFGGSKESTEMLPSVLKKNYPGITVSGIIQRDIKDNPEILEKIKSASPDILFVGLGTPYQENWIAGNSEIPSVPIRIAVGSGMEFISGVKKRAPLFFRKSGLEWIYRIYLEPKRLWKRYVFGIPIFLFQIIKFKFKLLTK